MNFDQADASPHQPVTLDKIEDFDVVGFVKGRQCRKQGQERLQRRHLAARTIVVDAAPCEVRAVLDPAGP